MIMNEHGLDARYFKEKLGQLVRDADNYTPAEMALALDRLSCVAHMQAPEISQAVAVAKPKKAAKRFVKPDTDDVAAYFHIKGVINYQEEAEVFCDHFESNGWKIGGKGAMKCWRAAVRNWIRRLDKGVFAAPEVGGMGRDARQLFGLEPAAEEQTGFVFEQVEAPADDGMALLLQASRARLEILG